MSNKEQLDLSSLGLDDPIDFEAIQRQRTQEQLLRTQQESQRLAEARRIEEEKNAFARQREIEAYNALPKSPQLLMSTGDIPYKYTILDLVFASGSSSEGVFSGVSPSAAYKLASNILLNLAVSKGAHAVIHVRFDIRSAVGQGILVGAYHVFEVYAYGTAVQCSDDSWPLIPKSK